MYGKVFGIPVDIYEAKLAFEPTELMDEEDALATIDDDDNEPAGEGGEEARNSYDKSRFIGLA